MEPDESNSELTTPEYRGSDQPVPINPAQSPNTASTGPPVSVYPSQENADPSYQQAPNSALPPQLTQLPQNEYLTQPKRPRRIFLVLATTVFIVMVVGATFAASSFNKNVIKPDSKSSKSSVGSASNKVANIDVPKDWVSKETELGVTVKAPPGWELSFTLDATVNNLKSRTLSISAPQAGTDAPLVSLGKVQRTDKKGQAAFEEVVATPDSSTYEEFGIDAKDVKSISSRTVINGKKWLQVDTTIPNQVTRTLYLWQGDHAISLTVLAQDTNTINSLASQYMYPMAASLSVN